MIYMHHSQVDLSSIEGALEAANVLPPLPLEPEEQREKNRIARLSGVSHVHRYSST